MKLKKLFLLLIFLLLISCSKKIENTYSSNLRIIHMNDHHSHLDYTKVKLKLNDKPILIDIGGIALDTTVIKGLKKEAEENSTPVLVLHAGDAEQGTIYYTLFKGESDAKLMNEIGFDAMAIGNHEFDDGDEHLAGFIRMLNMPALSANILPSKFSPLIDKIDSIKLDKSNKMAIIGLTVVKKTLDSSNPGKNIKFKDEFSSVQDIANALNNMGIEKIILLSHQGYKQILRWRQGLSILI
jgi:5'-nucleotidase